MDGFDGLVVILVLLLYWLPRKIYRRHLIMKMRKLVSYCVGIGGCWYFPGSLFYGEELYGPKQHRNPLYEEHPEYRVQEDKNYKAIISAYRENLMRLFLEQDEESIFQWRKRLKLSEKEFFLITLFEFLDRCAESNRQSIYYWCDLDAKEKDEFVISRYNRESNCDKLTELGIVLYKLLLGTTIFALNKGMARGSYEYITRTLDYYLGKEESTEA